MISLSESHGHVRPRPDGVLARCGGPRICKQCAQELTDLLSGQTQNTPQQERAQAAADLASRFTEPHDAWSAGWLSAAAYLAADWSDPATVGREPTSRGRPQALTRTTQRARVTSDRKTTQEGNIMRIVSRWYTYVGPNTASLRRGQTVKVVQNGFGSWADKCKVAGVDIAIPAVTLRGPGCVTAKKAAERVQVVTR